ncbi:MAG: radical SAM protein [Anaerolineae bacterium]|nr:radical SAM protein [Anaerolineae bacterium]
MDTFEKLSLLTADMKLEVAEDVRPPLAQTCPSFQPAQRGGGCEDPLQGFPISHAVMPNGRRMPILKTLVTSACERNCNYCCFRAGRDFRRVTFKPEEMANAIVKMTERGMIEGAFISSGVAGGGAHTQDRLIAMAEVLRNKLHYRGYLHLKLMPGSEYDQVLRSMQLADRISTNLEGPNSKRLQSLAPQKVFLEELLQPLRWAEQIRRSMPGHLGWNGHWPSTTTQFVVGAVGESDLELLSTTAYLNKNVRLARGYFSGFSPTPDTPFEEKEACNPWREHRLYQASFLLRDYGFDLEELPFEGEGNLPLERDPKLVWAQRNLSEAPLEVNRAGKEQLLRIPGFGPKSVQTILTARRSGLLHSLEDLKALGVTASRAAPFILVNGRRPAVQLSLWP